MGGPGMFDGTRKQFILAINDSNQDEIRNPIIAKTDKLKFPWN